LAQFGRHPGIIGLLQHRFVEPAIRVYRREKWRTSRDWHKLYCGRRRVQKRWPQSLELQPERFVSFSRGPLPRLDVLLDEGSGQCVGEVGGKWGVTRIADDLEDTAVPPGYYSYVLAQFTQEGGGRLKLRPPFQVEFSRDSFD
jgi:hypothetical protein